MKQDEINAKKAASPNGLTDTSVDGLSGVSSEVPLKDAPATDRIDEEYTDGDELDPSVKVRHPNRNEDKPDIDKPRYP
ncbi:hypothetical protein BWI93_08790 [Siphonobacter sp. BAB-5385]|uniref:hypothetical protein n=1 Tax=unclassified Siphonobacter TaxID=2635712 RepID=UPI000B9E3D08|nr:MULTISPECIES: hypothetical protein [unclassified Siphonobacter]OZI08486.1 hypothetical protein BWI93_08790 [Siphonobacter sp. BAB-5385]PMD99126.1 hypothetical protein BWI97_01590 [Siphonobacter sp. BAB-5405]